ncbi:MAG: hypothetical protein JNJ54_11950 [Myxococcaceae bacterium]|nr:hypothetical protein [Myxococcaceae bacterium]
MSRTLLPLVALALGAGCQTTLRQTRDLPPQLVLQGPTIGLDVTGPFRDAALQQLEVGLAQHGAPVRCEGACGGQTVVRARVVDTSVSPRVVAPDLMRAMTDVVVAATVDIDALDAAGQAFSSKRYFGSITGNVLRSPVEALKAEAVQIATRRFLRKLLPRRLDLELVVETGGDLEPGVERALSGDLAGAGAEFTRLTQARPDDAAAWYDLGVIRELEGDDDAALQAYQTAAGLKGRSLYRQAVRHLESRMNAN